MRIFAALLAVCLLQGIAQAGDVKVADNAQVFAQAEIETLSATTRWPFDLRVFTGTYQSRRDLDNAVHECIVAPNIVCIGIDPGHRFTYTHFGTATGVRPSDFNLIAASGNSDFKRRAWASGVTSIADRAYESARSAQAAPTVVVPPPTIVQQSEGVSGWWIFLIVAGLFGVGTLVYALIRKQKKLDRDMDSYREERNEYLDANVTRMTQPEPTPAPRRARSRTTYNPSTPPAPPPQTVVVDRGGGNDLLTGVLVGQALSRPAPVVVEREVVRETHHSSPSRRDDDSPSFSSGYSSDSGGGGSDFGGGGGGFDSGGGGFDGGGGGGDF